MVIAPLTTTRSNLISFDAFRLSLVPTFVCYGEQRTNDTDNSLTRNLNIEQIYEIFWLFFFRVPYT